MHNTYEVPDEIHPQTKRFAKLYSNVNSSVKGLRKNKMTPTQNPVHIGQANKSLIHLNGVSLFHFMIAP